MMKKVLFILGELSDDDIQWLVKNGSTTTVPAGTVLIHEGQPVDTLHVLLEGTLSVSTTALEGREIARLVSGEVVGEMSFVDARPPSATVQAVEQSLVLSISRPILGKKLQDDLGFASRFYRALAILLSTRLRGTVRQLGYSSEKPADDDSARENLDTQTLANVAIAEARFNNLLKQLKP